MSILIANPMSPGEIAQRIKEFEEQTLPKELHGLLEKRDGAALLVDKLKQVFTPESVATYTDEQKKWEAVGHFYKNQFPPRLHEALAIFAALYDHMLRYQIEADRYSNKGMPLVWMSDCYSGIGCPLIARRYLMLTLVEDVIAGGGNISADTTGSYFRVVWGGGLSDAELKRYAKDAYAYYYPGKKVSHPCTY